MPNLENFRNAFRALRHRNFRLFWAGQAISVSGTWMQTTAQSWLLYSLTGSPVALGLLSVAKFGPALAIAPFAGVITDRLPKRKVLLCTQSISLSVASMLAFLTLSGHIQVGHIMALALFQGCVDAVDMTVRQTFQMDLVGKDDLQSAVSLNSAAFNSARMIGPPMAGLLIAKIGEGPCFALNAISYLAVLISLFCLRVPPSIPAISKASITKQIQEGINYAWNNRAMRRVMVAVAMTSGVGLASYTLTPAFARDILKAGPQGYGNLLLGVGIGSILGSMTAATISSSRRASLVNTLMLCGQGLCLVSLSFSRTVPQAMLALTLAGYVGAMQLSTCNTYLQTQAPPELRGRIVSLYVWLLQGLTPVGGFAMGLAAQHAGIPTAILASGLACLLAGLWFAKQMKLI